MGKKNKEGRDPSHFLFLGGARSGKSAMAQAQAEMIMASGPRGRGLFLATATAGDQEMAARIELHRRQRGRRWRTVEEPLDPVRVILDDAGDVDVVLLDCLTMWISNLVMEGEKELDGAFGSLLEGLSMARVPVIMVSNEVGSGIVPASAEARDFRDRAGTLNQMVAGVCGTVVLVVAGVPLVVKGELTL